MYLDYILFIIGGILIAVSIILAVVLLRSRKRGMEYRRVLLEETQRIDVVTTLRQTQQLTVEGTNATEPITERQADVTEPLMAELDDEHKTEPLTLDIFGERKTELLKGEESAKDQNQRIGVGLDLSLLEGKYELLKEIHGGGMSRVFLARHRKLENEWIIKFVEHAELANEAEVLKKLNHISLPQIIDIFESGQGIFLVERYVEGCPMNEVLTLRQEIREGQICDWGIQLAQVLHYLHHLETPIIHCDLKPSNIMVTYDNRLVLIDFGISKRQGVSGRNMGITYAYAAPEQFRGNAAQSEIIEKRFGGLPDECTSWQIDERTDLYSAGAILFELVTGKTPTYENLDEIYEYATKPLADAIVRCMEIEPDKRFQSAEELVVALESWKGRQTSMARSLTMRRVAGVCCGVFLSGGLVTTASGAYVNQMENLAVVNMDPGKAVVTAQQSVEILIQKTRPNGKTVTLEPAKIRWSFSDENIARMDGNRLVGLNVGETTLYGQYRNKVVTLDVTVTEPIGELVDVALRYPEGAEVSVYAGTGEREMIDGGVEECAFVSPESLFVDEDGILYLSDSGVLRILEDGELSSVYMEPEYLTVSKVRAWEDELYILTGPWEAEDGESYYGFLRIGENGAEFLYYTEAAWSVISDFAFSSDGMLWFVQENMGSGMTTLNTLDCDTLESEWVMDLPDGAACMAFDEGDTSYISVPDSGVILRVGKGETEWSYFAGVDGEKNFIDGAVPNFYHPTALAAEGKNLYVLDFDTVRRITVEGKGALFTETLVGVPTEDTDPDVILGKGNQVVLPASELAGMTLDREGGLLLSDPKNSVIYRVSASTK